MKHINVPSITPKINQSKRSTMTQINIQLGQGGSAFLDTTDAYTPPSGMKIIMITI